MLQKFKDWVVANGKTIRRVSLYFVIIFGGAFCGILWYATFKQASYMWVPAACFTSLYALVLIFEVIGAMTGYKKTLSTRYNHWTKGWFWLSLIATTCFIIAMLALFPHFMAAW